jgi:hypothetical protein
MYLDLRNLAGALQNELTTQTADVEDGRLEQVHTLLGHQSRHTAKLPEGKHVI